MVKPIEIRDERVRAFAKEQSFGMTMLTVRGELKGPAVVQAAKYGNLKVTEATDDTGADLAIKDDSFFKTNQPELKSISQFERNDDRLFFNVRLKNPARTAKKVSLKGALDLLVGGKRVNADFAKVRSLAGTELKNPDLAALGIKIKLAKVDKSVNYIMEGNLGLIDEVIVLDSAGKKMENGGHGTFSIGKGPPTHTINFAQDIPADATLRFVLLKDAKTLTVPITFTNLELP